MNMMDDDVIINEFERESIQEATPTPNATTAAIFPQVTEYTTWINNSAFPSAISVGPNGPKTLGL